MRADDNGQLKTPKLSLIPEAVTIMSDIAGEEELMLYIPLLPSPPRPELPADTVTIISDSIGEETSMFRTP